MYKPSFFPRDETGLIFSELASKLGELYSKKIFEEILSKEKPELDDILRLLKFQFLKLSMPFNPTTVRFAKTMLCAHPQCPAEILREVFDNSNGDVEIIEPILSNPNCPEDIIEEAKKFNDPEIDYILDQREGGSYQPTEDELEKEEKSKAKIEELMSKIKEKPELAKVLGKHDVMKVLAHQDCPEVLFHDFANHPDEDFRASVARHKMCPQDILIKLSQDEVALVRNFAIENLCRGFVDGLFLEISNKGQELPKPVSDTDQGSHDKS